MFWQNVGNWFKSLGQSIGDFFMSKNENGFSNLEKIIICILLIVLAHFIIKLVIAGLEKAMGINRKKGPQLDKSAQLFGIQVFKILCWLLVACIVIAVLGINLNTFAGIISAIAVALGLALQDLIASFAYGLLILYEKNFATGDYISVQNAFGIAEGTVVRIGLLSTRLKSFNGQLVVVPNGNLAKANVTNFTRFPERRISFTVGVSYDSDIQLAKDSLLAIMNADPRILQDSEHKPNIHVAELGAYSVNIAIKVWVDYKVYWDVYNGLNEQILLSFREKGINIPSSTDLQIKKVD